MYRIILFFLLIPCFCFAQTKVTLIHADSLKGGIKGDKRYERVMGNVKFTQNTTTIYCDSSHFYRAENRLEAFGHVHIVDDSVDITSLRMDYDGTTKVAHLREKVVFEKTKIAKLYTDFLDYYRQKNEARYFNGGKLVDTTNTLTSRKGYYDINTNLASFKTEVVAVNADYTLTSDTLQYNSQSRLVYFRDFTTVIDSEKKKAYYQSGVYDSRRKTSTLFNGEMESPTYEINADDYFIDDANKLYKVAGQVVMKSKAENLSIYGDKGFYDRKNGISKVYGNAFAAKVDEKKDTLFLTADTLVSIESVNPKKKKLLAYHHVKIYKTDMQGIADSLVYMAADSMVFFYRDPVLWTEGNQMTADSIRMLMRNKSIDRIYMISNSFVVSQDSLRNFNQIKGKRMTTFFQKSKIHHINVDGNGESIYYALEEKTIKTDSATIKITALVGMNKIICSNIRIEFKSGKVHHVNFYIKPDASFFPPFKIDKKNTRLKGFTWRGEDRPLRKDVVKRRVKKQDSTDNRPN